MSKPKVTLVNSDEMFQTVDIEVETADGRVLTSGAERKCRRGQWLPTQVCWNLGPSLPGGADQMADAIHFAAQIARRLDAGETIAEGEEYDG